MNSKGAVTVSPQFAVTQSGESPQTIEGAGWLSYSKPRYEVAASGRATSFVVYFLYWL